MILDLDTEAPPTFTVRIGGKEYAMDPITIVLKLEAGAPQDQHGLSEFIAFVRQVFGIPELKDAQALMLVGKFKNYVEELQKKMLPQPISFPSTAFPSGKSIPQTGPASS